jgi:hypothetical protein
VGQRGVAGAEIVQLDLDTGPVQSHKRQFEEHLQTITFGSSHCTKLSQGLPHVSKHVADALWLDRLWAQPRRGRPAVAARRDPEKLSSMACAGCSARQSTRHVLNVTRRDAEPVSDRQRCMSRWIVCLWPKADRCALKDCVR